MSFSISVIIPNYNGKNLLEENIPFLLSALKEALVEFEVIISDDASTDNSIEFIKQKYPDIKIIESNINSGFSSTVNKGIIIAKNDLVFLLNSDVKLTSQYFLSLFKYFEYEDAFGVMGCISTESTNKIQDAAKYPKWKGSQIVSTLNYLIKNKSEKLILTFFLSGANALIDRKKLQELKGMNENFNPFYYEDVELSIRAWRLGWHCYYEPQAICYHKMSSTINKYHERKKIKILSKRNKMMLHAIHLEGIKKIQWHIKMLLNCLFRWLILDFLFYRSLFQVFQKHKMIKKSKHELGNLFVKHEMKKSLSHIISYIQKDTENVEKIYF